MSAWRLSRLGVAVWTGCETAGAGVEPTAGASCPAHTALAVTTAREQSKKVLARAVLGVEWSSRCRGEAVYEYRNVSVMRPTRAVERTETANSAVPPLT
jgi:hypothetical protein